jgi:asparagine synthase (glutamine-hydrolysing)
VFYLIRGDKIYFASEIKALLEVPGWNRGLDLEGLWHFFSLAYIPGSRTPFAEIRELPAGHFLDIDLKSGHYAEKRYYALRRETDESLTEDAAAQGVRQRLRDAVTRSLTADVPVGMTLSGGFDTSSLLALAKESGLGRKLHTFSIRINEPSFDESRYQRLMAEFVGSIHHEITVNPSDVLACLHATAAHLDEPSGDGAAAPTFLLSREARRHVKVLLSGEGGDEIFNAYETHRACQIRRAYRRWAPDWARAVLRNMAARLPVSHNKLSLDFLSKRFTEGAELDAPEAHFFWRHALSEEDKLRLLTCPPAKPTASLFREYFDSLSYPDELDRIAAIDLRYYFIDDLMVKNDRSIMAHSVETRFPYMERDVVEFAARIPSRFKVRGFQGRRIQKLAMRDALPPAILRRSNMGLEMPHSIWFLREFKALAEHYFSTKHIERSGLLRPEMVQQLWREHLARRRDNGRPLWCILNFLLWFDLFVYEGNYKQYLQKAP